MFYLIFSRLPFIDRDRKSLTTLTQDGFLVICTEYERVIYCHAKDTSSETSEIKIMRAREKDLNPSGSFSKLNFSNKVLKD